MEPDGILNGSVRKVRIKRTSKKAIIAASIHSLVLLFDFNRVVSGRFASFSIIIFLIPKFVPVCYLEISNKSKKSDTTGIRRRV